MSRTIPQTPGVGDLLRRRPSLLRELAPGPTWRLLRQVRSTEYPQPFPKDRRGL
jgi:hypothetical protein